MHLHKGLKKHQPKHPDGSHTAIHKHASPALMMGKAKVTDKDGKAPKKKIGEGRKKV